MSSLPYPVLNNKPIDQWKVTELKEELKRRKLPLKGLKDDLVRRLDEALRQEMNSQMEEEIEEEQVEEEEEEEQVETPPIPTGNGEEVEAEEASPAQPVQVEKMEAPVLLEKPTTETAPEEKLENPKSAPGAKFATEDYDVNMEGGENIEPEVEELKTEATGGEPACASSPFNEIPERESKDAEQTKPVQAEPNEQVSQVGPDTGSQEKCESISTNESNKCINVENKLKDNLNANNFDLEKQVEVKQDIQGDKNKEPVKNQADTSTLEGENYEITPSNNISNIIGADGGSPEKLHLDRSSGDESMEEDLIESSKPVVKSMGGGVRDVVKEVVNSENASADTAMIDDVAAEGKVRPEEVALPEKRKLEAQEVVPNNNENIKRQRRWNTETLKVPERQTLNLTGSSTPKDRAPPVPPKHTLSRSDSNASLDSPKERIFPPSQKAATNSLRIDKFLRPFTLKAVQELLGKTGTVSSFWMDHIKTHCYVTYSSVEEAVATRNAVYNLQWPPNGGNQLIADFVDPQEVKQRLETPLQSPAVAVLPPISPHPNLSTTPKPPPLSQPAAPQHPFSRQNSTPRNQQQQAQLPPPPPLPTPVSGNVKPARERLPPPPPLRKSDPQPAVVTLDDLFRKTKAVPRVYYLPLSEETVAAKLAARAKAAKE